MHQSVSVPQGDRPKTMQHRTVQRSVFCTHWIWGGLLCASLWGSTGCERSTPTLPLSTPPAQAQQPTQAQQPAPQMLSDERNNIEIFRQAAPSTVYITRISLRTNLLTLDTFRIPSGTGSGFIWDRQGHIVTNYHVVEGAEQISVTLADQSNWPAQLVGAAPAFDIAVLRIKAPAKQIIPLPQGRSETLQVGQKVLAIGNPFGLDATLTTGVISALGREIAAPNRRRIRNVVQTDAAINPGNSGGPLLDSAGRLIGMNTAILSASGSSAGIGFAVPVDTIAKVAPQLIDHGRVIRPVLGVNLLPDSTARRFADHGAVLLAVVPKMPAEQAGLRGLSREEDGRVILGDVIVSLGGRPVQDNDDLLNAIEQYQPGEEVILETMRQGKKMRFTLRLGEP